MISLLLNEIKKVVRKKSFYITIIVMFAFCCLINLAYKSLSIINFEDEFMESDVEYINSIKDDEEKKEEYVNLKSSMDFYNFHKKYDKDSWQYGYITQKEDIYENFNVINSYEKGLNDNKDAYDMAKNNLEQLEKKLSNGSWEDLVKEEIKFYEELIYGLDNPVEKKTYEITIEGLKKRLDYNISYKLDYLNNALNDYIESKIELVDFDGKDIKKLNDFEKNKYNDLREKYLTSEYVVENKIAASDNIGSLKGILQFLFQENIFVIMVVIFMIGGSIVSSEYDSGTIKLLLIKPFTRTKILVSKYIVTLLSILFACFTIFVFHFIIGGLFFGFDSISTPVLLYSNITDTLQTYNIFTFVLLNFLACLPYLIILATLAFALSTIFKSTPLAIVVSFIGYIVSITLTDLLAESDKIWLKYVVCFNWNFYPYIFKLDPSFKGQNIIFSLLICIITLLVLIVPSFIVFKRRDITNE